jgi:hypothetical protein
MAVLNEEDTDWFPVITKRHGSVLVFTWVVLERFGRAPQAAFP